MCGVLFEERRKVRKGVFTIKENNMNDVMLAQSVNKE